jgi:hypothetical protein
MPDNRHIDKHTDQPMTKPPRNSSSDFVCPRIITRWGPALRSRFAVVWSDAHLP